jgi:hypothetical protein
MAVTLRARRCFESPSVPCACDAGVGNATAFVNLYGNFSDVLSRSAVVDQVFRRSASDARFSLPSVVSLAEVRRECYNGALGTLAEYLQRSRPSGTFKRPYRFPQ